MRYKFESKILRPFKYVHSTKTNIRVTINRELKRLGVQPIVKVEFKRG